MQLLPDTATRSNPHDVGVLGASATKAAQVAVGIAGSSYFSSKLFMPFARGLWAGVASANNAMAQAVNAVGTLGGGWLGGFALDLAGFSEFARNWRFGAVVMASAKLIAIPVKDFFLDSGFPEIPFVGRVSGVLGGGVRQPMQALPGGSSAPIAVSTAQKTGAGTMGF